MEEKGLSSAGAGRGGGGGKISADKSVKPPFTQPGGIGGVVNAAIGGLTENEDAATKAGFGGGSGNDKDTQSPTAAASKSEENPGGLYTGSGRDSDDDDSDDDDNEEKDHNIFRGSWGVIGAVIGFFVAIIGFSTGTTAPLVSMGENLIMSNGQNSAIISKRANYFMTKMLSSVRRTTTTGVWSNKRFKIPANLVEKLKKENIHYIEMDDAGDGRELKMLVYEDADGRKIPVVANDADVDRVNRLVSSGAEIDIDGSKVKLTGSGMTLSDARSSNDGFDISYKKATQIFNSPSAGWWDDTMNKVMKKLGLTRNQMDDVEDEDAIKKKMYGNASPGEEESEYSAKSTDNSANDPDTGRLPKDTVIVDDDGVPVVDPESGRPYTVGDIDSSSDALPTTSPSEPEITKALNNKAVKAASISTTLVCAFWRSVGTISAAVGAIQAANALSYASKLLEIKDKVKAGKADATTNTVMNDLSKTVTTKSWDADGNEVSLTGSVLQSKGWEQHFTNKNIIDENDPGVLITNREMVNKYAMRAVNAGAFAGLAGFAAMGASIKVVSACLGVQATAGVLDGIVDWALVLFTPGGIGKGVKAFFAGAVKSLKLVLVMAAVSIFVSMVVPKIATWLSASLMPLCIGLVGGFLFSSGAHILFTDNMLATTGKLADKKNAIETKELAMEAEKEWADYERKTRSPFDASSRYTFLGSITSKIASLAGSLQNPIVSTLPSMIGMAGSSAIAMISPTASATGELNEYANSFSSKENCPNLSSVGDVGDKSCNKTAGAYVEDLTSKDPDETEDKMENKYDSFVGEDEYGIKQIKQGSEYAKFLLACVANDTQPGTVSAVVQGGISKFLSGFGKPVVGGLINVGLSLIPGNGFLNAWDAGDTKLNMPYNTQDACDGNADGIDEEMIRTFSDYTTDQRVGNIMGVLESNPIANFFEDYYEKNPIDNSPEGVIARFSGLSKEDAAFFLDTVDYLDFIAHYNASERFAFGQEKKPEGAGELKFDNDNKVAHVILLNEIEFADVRNRNYVV